MSDSPKYSVTLGDKDVDALIEALPLAALYSGRYAPTLLERFLVSGEAANRKLALHSGDFSQEELQIIGLSVMIAIGLLKGEIQPFVDIEEFRALAEYSDTYIRLAPMFEKMLNETLGSGSQIETLGGPHIERIC